MSQSTFPLFSTLEQKIEEEHIDLNLSLSDVQKQFICDQVKSMDDISVELVYAIIRFYHLQYESGNIMELPYQMKKQKTGSIYKIDLNDMPLKLQHFVLLFTTMYRDHNDIRS
jgi:hypothetical protein